ncbi:hypothetical protein ACE7GA_24470 [Roseomonas sp. CCTCC AB2023176]|uniref:hypothetical protein n=1 Tax=Roseomonas sp. CCTCC AB2023176 TaxID=3342640 RepID=UPI0035E1F88D
MGIPTALRAGALVAALAALPGCVVVPVPTYYDTGAVGAGAALGAAIGTLIDQSTAAYPPPGAVWDPYARVWRLP